MTFGCHIFRFIGMPGQNVEYQNWEPTFNTPCEGEQLSDIDLAHCMEVELQEAVSQTCQESSHKFSVSKSHCNSAVSDDLISPPSANLSPFLKSKKGLIKSKENCL